MWYFSRWRGRKLKENDHYDIWIKEKEKKIKRVTMVLEFEEFSPKSPQILIEINIPSIYFCILA